MWKENILYMRKYGEHEHPTINLYQYCLRWSQYYGFHFGKQRFFDGGTTALTYDNLDC